MFFNCLLVPEKVYSISLEETNNPCSFDGTANMAAHYCVNLDNFF